MAVKQSGWTDLHQLAWLSLIEGMESVEGLKDYSNLKIEVQYDYANDKNVVMILYNGAVIKDDFNGFPSEQTIAKVRLLGL